MNEVSSVLHTLEVARLSGSAFAKAIPARFY